MRKKLIRTEGIYLLYSNDELIYIGQSKFCERRIYEHLKTKMFDEYKIIRKEEESLNELEACAIVLLKPKYNKSIPKNNRFITIENYIFKKNKVRLYGTIKRRRKLESLKIKSYEIGKFVFYKITDLDKIYG